jgi:hypothetical protein
MMEMNVPSILVTLDLLELVALMPQEHVMMETIAPMICAIHKDQEVVTQLQQFALLPMLVPMLLAFQQLDVLILLLIVTIRALALLILATQILDVFTPQLIAIDVKTLLPLSAQTLNVILINVM